MTNESKRKIAILLAIIFVVSSTVLGFVLVQRNEYSNALMGFCSILFLLFPIVLSKLGIKIPYSMYIFFFSFCILAYTWGCVMSGYQKFWFLDGLAHFISGFLFTTIGICLYYLLNKDNSSGLAHNIAIIVTYGIFFSLFIAVCWEIIEFVDFNLTGHDGQHHLDTGVFDTMKDLILCYIASIICGVVYGREAKTGRFFFLGVMIKDFYDLNINSSNEHLTV